MAGTAAPWGGPVYAYPFPTAQIVTTETVYGEVRLFNVLDDKLVWAASTATFAPNNPAQDSAAFAQVVVGQLAAGKLI
jgi:hypothetical protein